MSGFARLEAALRTISREHRWPGTLVIERFTSNTANHPREVRLFVHGFTVDAPGELTFRVWLTVIEGTVEHDLGVVRCNYFPHLAERFDDIADRLYYAAARLIAAKIEAVLFPRRDPPSSSQGHSYALGRPSTEHLDPDASDLPRRSRRSLPRCLRRHPRRCTVPSC